MEQDSYCREVYVLMDMTTEKAQEAIGVLTAKGYTREQAENLLRSVYSAKGADDLDRLLVAFIQFFGEVIDYYNNIVEPASRGEIKVTYNDSGHIIWAVETHTLQ